MKIGFQGRHGTFSEIAALSYFSTQEIEPCGYPNFKLILEDVQNGVLDYALLPVENTTTGIISRTYDLLCHYDIHVIGEIDIPIHEDLIVVPGTKIEEIREVYSHPEALLQCSGFFAEHPEIKSMSFQDTARSVEYIRDCNDRSKAALGSWRAREYYGMESLIRNVQDNDLNMTRFFAVSAKKEVAADADKISMMIVLKHEPGTLYRALGILNDQKINILKLESRPIRGRVFEYMFYIDFSGNMNDENVEKAVRALQESSEESKLMGCYKAAVPFHQEKAI